jgi:hypothetical protein
LTRLRPVQTAANPRTEPETARRLRQTPVASFMSAAAPRPHRRTTGRRSVRAWFCPARSRCQCGSAGSSSKARFMVLAIAAATHEDLR